MKHKINFDTQYNQFYLADQLSDADTGANTFWTDIAYKDRLAILNGTLGIGTESYGHINGEIIILEKENKDIDFTIYDHIVEGGLNIKSGILQIRDCPMNALQLELKLNPGKYRVRVYSSNLKSVLETDSYDDFNDYYKIEIWPDENMELKVLKVYTKG